MQALVNIALRAAREGAAILTGTFDRLDRVRLLDRREGRVITNTHLDVEKAMLAQLQKIFPQHGYQSAVSDLPEPGDAGTVWFLDPLIGSTNFLRGSQGFLLGLYCHVDGQVKLSVFIDPLLNEEFTAVRGNGASLNGRRIRVGNQTAFKDSLVAMEFEPEQEQQRLIPAMEKVLEQGASIRSSGNVILDLVNVAAGRLDGGMAQTPAASLLAGAGLLLQEAGGLISDTSGNPQLSGAQVVFGNPRYFKQLLQLTRVQS